MAALPPPLPEEALPPALPAPAAVPALPPARSGDSDPGEDGEAEATGTVVGFGLFDPFGEDKGNHR